MKLWMVLLLGWGACVSSLVPNSANHLFGGCPLLSKTMSVSRHSAKYVCQMNPDDFKDPKIETRQLTILNSRRSRYAYEQMIFSRLADSGAKCIDAYYLTSAGSAEFSRTFDRGFYSALRKFCGEVQHESGDTGSVPSVDLPEKIKPGDRFQMNICISFEEDMTVCSMFKDVAEDGDDVFAINSLHQTWKDIVISSGDNVYFEVCEAVEKLPSKLYQVERTLQLWDSCMPKDVPFPKVAGIIMNGDRDALAGPVKLIQNAVWNYGGMEPKLRSLPMFIIYSKYTNVYLELSKLGGKVDAGFARMDARFSRMDAGFSRMDAGFAIVLAAIAGLCGVVLTK
jgi:hypothetical protein